MRGFNNKKWPIGEQKNHGFSKEIKDKCHCAYLMLRTEKNKKLRLYFNKIADKMDGNIFASFSCEENIAIYNDNELNGYIILREEWEDKEKKNEKIIR